MAKNRGTDAQLLTIHELAVYLHLDEATVTKLVTAGKIPSIQVDRQWRFKPKSIDEWIEQQLVGDDESFADVPAGSSHCRARLPARSRTHPAPPPE